MGGGLAVESVAVDNVVVGCEVHGGDVEDPVVVGEEARVGFVFGELLEVGVIGEDLDEVG